MILFTIAGIIFIIFIFFLVRKSLLHPINALIWFFCGFFLIILGVLPNTYVDPYFPKTAASYIYTILFILLIVRLLSVDIQRSKMLLQIRLLAQEQAALKHALYDLKKVSTQK